MLYSLTKPLAKAWKPGPEWNTMDITLDGPRTIVTLNGVKITDYKDGDRCRIASLISSRSAVRGLTSDISVCKITAITTSCFLRKWQLSHSSSQEANRNARCLVAKNATRGSHKSFSAPNARAQDGKSITGGIGMKRILSRRAFLQGSAAAAAGGLLVRRRSNWKLNRFPQLWRRAIGSALA